MIIKISEIDIPNLIYEIYDHCPVGTNEAFSDGYTYFVENFFEYIEFFSMVYLVDVGVADIDINKVTIEILNYVDSHLEEFDANYKKSFLTGIESAVEPCIDTIKLASYYAKNKLAA